MTAHGAFPADEFGSGSRPTPLIDAPSWLLALSQRESAEADRATLTPGDHAFLEALPTYQESAVEQDASPLSAEPIVIHKPSTARRVVSLLLFVAIGGSSCGVLVLAALRLLGHALPW